ncbi:E3 ubiquitin-protein ligase ZFP91-like [Salarias fasciatus]|uniref:E3 ubiquitin-protein ligase ZFP91 n=1 Tax=Salarias fasciatus TaxID=181472 RepID=A0A672FYT3_SALFA|nr:E3 ubiquitin-protein ligase ZFP91-like [Salarias fasciatus]
MDSGGKELSAVRVDNTAAVNSSPDWTDASSGRRGSRRRLRTAVTPAVSCASQSGAKRVLRARTVVPDGGNDSQDATRKKSPRCGGGTAGSRSGKAPVTHGKSRCRASLPQTEVKKEESDQEEEEKRTEKEGSPQAVVQSEDAVGDNAQTNRKRNQRDDKAPRQPKRRQKPPVQYVRCEMEGCGTILAHPRYLQHHIKYQHLLKKRYVCDHPSCGRLFRLQKQLLRHAKHHTDQRDYICEYCARAFKSSYNLAVHRMIHTGEKPIQCEICGFTCRQKASLNWHMKKHDVEASYQFPCSICGKKFEKKDSVVAHKAKIHPKVLIAEAMAANGGLVISASVARPVSQESQELQKDSECTLAPLQQVALPFAPQEQFLQSPLQVASQQLAAAPPAHLYSDPPGLTQLSPVSPSEGTQTPGEAVPWDGVMVGQDPRHAGDLLWEGSEERRKENDAIVWEQEGERLIL